MGCWKWFNKVFDDADIKVTFENQAKIKEVIHKYIGEQSKYGRSSADWRTARKDIQTDPEIRGELVEKLKILS